MSVVNEVVFGKSIPSSEVYNSERERAFFATKLLFLGAASDRFIPPKIMFSPSSACSQGHRLRLVAMETISPTNQRRPKIVAVCCILILRRICLYAYILFMLPF